MPRYDGAMPRLYLPLLCFAAFVVSACGDDPRTTPPITYDPPPQNNQTNNQTTPASTNNQTTPATNNQTTPATNNQQTNNQTTPHGETCPDVTGDPFNGECDIVRNEGCTAPEQCFMALLLNGPEVDVSSACFESDVHVLQEDDFCEMTEERCAPTMLCIAHLRVCKRLCYLADGSGCMPDEWCVQADANWKGIGYCADTCE